MHSRQILVYSKDAQVQRRIANLGFAGEVLSTDRDYLGIFNSNLGGTKTDLSIEQSVKLVSKILSDGSIVNTLEIIRKNLDTEDNNDYLRALVPAGSQLLSATGFDEHEYFNSTSKGLDQDSDLAKWDQGELKSNVFIRTEANKTEFAGWLKTPSQQDKVVKIVYRLPFKVFAEQSYSLLLQKQSGSKPLEFQGQVELGDFKASWLGPDMKISNSSISFGSNTNTDDFWPLIIAK